MQKIKSRNTSGFKIFAAASMSSKNSKKKFYGFNAKTSLQTFKGHKKPGGESEEKNNK